MKHTPVEWLEEELKANLTKIILQYDDELIEDLFTKAKEMEKDRETRIKELETFLQEDILDDVYYYHSPIWHRATELLNKDKDE